MLGQRELRPEMMDFRSDRADFRPEKPGGTDERTNGRTDERMDGISPHSTGQTDTFNYRKKVELLIRLFYLC